MTDLKDRIKSLVGEDLRSIEEALEKNLNPYYDLVSAIAGHILFAGGKRLRPLLMVLSSRICGYKGNYDKTFSVLFEYLHAATLIHDDLVDGADKRRGKPAAHTTYGNPQAVLTGDFLLARALSLAARTGLPKVISIIAGITEDMSQGEIQQLENKGRLDLSEAEYMDVIFRKTAVLIRGACQSGALIAGANPEQEQALASYGQAMGIAFQMADDLLDYTADSMSLGKDIGADLREGKLTLPIIHALFQANDDDRLWMETLIRKQSFDDEEFRRFTTMIDHYGGLSYTRSLAVEHVRRAKQSLCIFPESETRQILDMLADYALVRKA
ncbi:MAG: polyprenyl synthetase family protein [Proteobacteria bacterium]|nr:polyprenyl synthetase family protein [Pseudomonadota bacterium]